MGAWCGIILLVMLCQGQPHAAPLSADQGRRVPIQTVQSPRGSVLVVSNGTAHRFRRGAPGAPERIAAAPLGESTLRVVGSRVLLVDTDADSIRVLDANGVETRRVALPFGSRPVDVLARDDGAWLVSSRGLGGLLLVDPESGAWSLEADLSLFADDDGDPDLGLMARAGERVFVQVRRLVGGNPFNPEAHGALAVYDLGLRTVVDCNAALPGVQPVELIGPSPRFKMRVSGDGERLLVSATSEHHLHFGGGIEAVDTVALASEGFVVTEIEVASIGAFAMLNDEAGVLVFHTDIVPSNHTLRFTLAGGPVQGVGAVTDLGAYVDAVEFDAGTGLLYVGGAEGVVYLVDARRDEVFGLLTLEQSGVALDFAVVE